MKIQMYVVRDELNPNEADPNDRIFLRAVKDGKPVGPEIPMLMDEWEQMNPLQVGDRKSRIFEYELSEAQVKENKEFQERIDWLMDPKRLIFLLRVLRKDIDPFDAKNMFILGDISTEYQKKFHKPPFEFVKEIKLLPDILQSIFSEEK